MRNGKFLVVAVVTSVLLSAPAIASAKTWYDGGYKLDGHTAWKPTCPVAQKSPAAEYKLNKSIGETPRIIDRGEEVEVKAGEATFYFFRTKKACEIRAAKLSQEKTSRKKQQQQFLNRYN